MEDCVHFLHALDEATKTSRNYPFNLPYTVLTSPETTKDHESVSKVMSNYSLMLEYTVIQRIVPPGLYILPSLRNPYLRLWKGLVLIRQGWYRGSIFHFEMVFPTTYPQVAPQVRFKPPYPNHPQVCSRTGVLSFSGTLEKWSPREFFSLHVLGYIKCLFYKKETFLKTKEDAELYLKEIRNPSHVFWQTLKQTTLTSIDTAFEKAINGSLFDDSDGVPNPQQNKSPRITQDSEPCKTIVEMIRESSLQPNLMEAKTSFMKWYSETYTLPSLSLPSS